MYSMGDLLGLKQSKVSPCHYVSTILSRLISLFSRQTIQLLRWLRTTAEVFLKHIRGCQLCKAQVMSSLPQSSSFAISLETTSLKIVSLCVLSCYALAVLCAWSSLSVLNLFPNSVAPSLPPHLLNDRLLTIDFNRALSVNSVTTPNRCIRSSSSGQSRVGDAGYMIIVIHAAVPIHICICMYYAAVACFHFLLALQELLSSKVFCSREVPKVSAEGVAQQWNGERTG